jgi:hypothetical protein
VLRRLGLGRVGLSSRYFDPRWPGSLLLRDHRIEFDIVQSLTSAHDTSIQSHRPLVFLRDGHEAYAPAYFPQRSPDTGARVGIRRHVIRQVSILEVAGRLSDVAKDLDHEIQRALADGPRGVVCDLTGVLEGVTPSAVEVLATAGRHVRDWPGMPVCVACPKTEVRSVLAAHLLGGHLMLTESLLTGITSVLAAPALATRQLCLVSHPTAPRASGDFVTSTLQEWLLGSAAPFASRVVRELVASSCTDAGTEMRVSIAWDRGALRLAVRDHGPALPSQRPCPLDLHGRTLTVVEGLSRAYGVLPTNDAGRAAWAVIDAPRRNSIQVRKNAQLLQTGRNTWSGSIAVVRQLPNSRWWRSRRTAPAAKPSQQSGSTGS